ncbi:MAG: mechanosensitive ion channel [Lachnospiraceae bacterium]|nr:mechanosensitive ion channel [Lachnospiraceae bacterium]
MQNQIIGSTGLEDINPGVIEQFLRELPDKALRLGIRVLLAVVFFAIGVQLIKAIRKIVKKSLQRTNADTGLVQFMDSFIKASLYIVLIFMIAESFGVDATSIVALLGSAGVAIGLAIQGSLSNFAGGILILLLKPFKVGDYIIEDSKGNEGTVLEIQLFYTKLVTPDDKVIILPNGTLANTSLTNVTATEVRRAEVKVGISYDADIKQAKQVLSSVLQTDESVLKNQERVVYVDELGDSAVVLVLRCWFKNEDYWEGKWRVTENAKLALDANQISIPYPQMDVHIRKTEIER